MESIAISITTKHIPGAYNLQQKLGTATVTTTESSHVV